MLRKERAAYIQNRLQQLYPETPIPLDHKDPYTLLIAVLLSAQCTDVRVNQITPLLFARADTPQDMLKLSVEEIKEIIRPCGLSPMKSKGIAGLSQILLDEGVKYLLISRRWKHFQRSVTKRLRSLWLKPLACHPFPLIHTSIA